MNLVKPIFGLLSGRRLPTIEGRLGVEGIASPVKIGRDQYGISYIHAENAEDVWYGLGFCHGQDRAFQIESSVRVARGTFAEVAGSAALPIDRLSRRIGFYRSAQEQLDVISSDVRCMLETYARGVNSGIRKGCRNLPHEFALLGMKPTELTAVDILGIIKLFCYAMAFNWDCEIMRYKVLTQDGPEALKALDHSYPEYKTTIPPCSSIAGDAINWLAADLALFSSTVGMSGSCNNWTIASSRTATGRPILANDLHIGPSIPTPWYLCKVSTPEFSAVGASFPGAPAVVLGHNGVCAWGMTAGMSDVVDLFVEKIGPDGKSVCQGDSFLPCEVRKETIRVKGAAPVEEEILITPRGPIISPALQGVDVAFSMSAVWLKKMPIVGLLDVHKMKSFESIQQTFEHWALPIHMVYADSAGNIGWELVGRVPKRKKGSGTLPQAGWDPEAGWEEDFVPVRQMPRQANPEAGFFATGNNKPLFGFKNDPFIAVDWVDGYRATRITEMLSQRTDWDNASVMQLHQDLYTIPWREIKDIVLYVPAVTEQTKQAIVLLSRWDGVTSADSVATSVYEFFMNEMLWRVSRAKAPRAAKWIMGEGVDPLLPHTFVPMRRASHLVRLIREQPEGWFVRSWKEEMADALSVSVDRLKKKYGNSPERWAWGRVRPLTMTHQFGGKFPLNKIFNVGPFPWGGDTHTIAQSYVDQLEPDANPGVVVTLRAVIDVGNWDENSFVLGGGQSGNPYSPHYADMLELLKQGKGTPIAWSPEKEKEVIRTTLELVPELG
jgi:penicillin amidase